MSVESDRLEPRSQACTLSHIDDIALVGQPVDHGGGEVFVLQE